MIRTVHGKDSAHRRSTNGQLFVDGVSKTKLPGLNILRSPLGYVSIGHQAFPEAGYNGTASPWEHNMHWVATAQNIPKALQLHTERTGCVFRLADGLRIRVRTCRVVHSSLSAHSNALHSSLIIKGAHTVGGPFLFLRWWGNIFIQLWLCGIHERIVNFFKFKFCFKQMFEVYFVYIMIKYSSSSDELTVASKLYLISSSGRR
jgi:hypothetical protein